MPSSMPSQPEWAATPLADLVVLTKSRLSVRSIRLPTHCSLLGADGVRWHCRLQSHGGFLRRQRRGESSPKASPPSPHAGSPKCETRTAIDQAAGVPAETESATLLGLLEARRLKTLNEIENKMLAPMVDVDVKPQDEPGRLSVYTTQSQLLYNLYQLSRY